MEPANERPVGVVVNLRALLRSVLVMVAFAIGAGAWQAWHAHRETSGERLERLARTVGPVTFHDDVSVILQQNCQVCHRTGGAAPFPLVSFEEAYAHRDRIRDAVLSGRMPPWLPDPDVGTWANERRVPERDVVTLLAWIRQGAPEGHPGAAPPPRDWPEGWSIGEPDAVVRLPRPIPVPEAGVLPYRYVYVETDFPGDRWVQALQIRPTAPEVVHHAIVLVEEPLPGVRPSSTGRIPPFVLRQEGFGNGVASFFAVHVPGHTGVTYPAAYARRLPKGATLKFQLHYTPNGTAMEDRTELGLIFAEEPPTHRVETGAALNTRFVIPPGARGHEVVGTHRFEEPRSILGFFPHMHLRGAAFRYDLVHADGSEETILNLPRYDFDWQEEYILEQPIHVPAGTLLRATGVFDNSRYNPHNPDPGQIVRFGEQTYEEMMNGYFHVLVPRKDR